MIDKTELQMAQRHVQTGERLVTQQGELVAELLKCGSAVEEAISLLEIFKDLQRQHELHLAQLEEILSNFYQTR